jgi:tRNA A64-2'-O-ribosylphosphate transferase
MAETPSFPSSISSLIFPTASQNLSNTLSSLKRSTLSTSNRLQSIHHDAVFVQDVARALSLPLVANERCGSWYISPEQKGGSAYFKSTDGHWGQWSFSSRRLNLQILDRIGEYGGWVRETLCAK